MPKVMGRVNYLSGVVDQPGMMPQIGTRPDMKDFLDKLLVKRMLRLLPPSIRTLCSLVSATIRLRTRGNTMDVAHDLGGQFHQN
jgi:hypothetical protein